MVHYPRDELSRGLIGHWKLDDLKRVATDGIIAHYKMNDNAASTVVIDSKSGNNGTAARNTSLFTTASGKIGRALIFNGADDYVDTFNSNSFFNTNGFTLSAWIKPETEGEGTISSILNKSEGGSAGNLGFNYYTSPSGGGTKIAFKINNGTESKSINIKPYGQWIHVLITVTSAQIAQHFINGVADGGAVDLVQPISAITTTNALRIGNRAGATDKTFDGSIDDVRIYDRVLTQTEINTIYNSNSGTETTELFRDTVTAIDRANFNDGTITGATNADGQNWKPSNSMSFDGVDDVISHTGYDLQPPFSVNIWFNASITGQDDYIFWRNDDEPSMRFNNENKLQFLVEGGVGNVIITINTISTGIWYMATLTYDGLNLKGYLNGILQGSTTQEPFISGTELYKFGTDGNTERFFKGLISNIRTYNRVLTDNEIKKLYRLRK